MWHTSVKIAAERSGAQVKIELTLAIEPVPAGTGLSTATVCARLANLDDGRLVAWSPDMNDAPARATFVFQSQAARDRFVAGALAMNRVSLWTPPM